MTRTIRVKTEDWRAFSTLALIENKSRSELFGILLINYVENHNDLSIEQRSLIMTELKKVKD